MNLNNAKTTLLNSSALRFWLTTLLVVWFLGVVGLGWLVKSFLVLLGFLMLAPVLMFWGFRWWLKRNLIEDDCPVCQFHFAGLNKTQTQCPNCGELIQIQDRQFQRLTPPGTVDVQAIEVPAQTLED
uniref:Uncharacterized protein n=1 Tax=Cyanothece sp. (strain PCC 7425 / ATCC 29141) TaxID=395961 RepID=B8HJN3_CYAP4